MSDLQALCESLVAIDHDIAMVASRLDGQARQLHAAAVRAASLQSADVQSGLNAERAAVALEQAARATANAARLLNQASLAGQAFVARSVGRYGGGGGGSAGGDPAATSTQSAADPELGDGLAYVSSAGRGLFGESGVGFTVPEQGYLGDCYLIASLSAVAGCRPDVVRSRFTQAEGDAVEVFGVRVADSLPADHDGDVYGASSDGSGWVGLAEKAYAATHGGYEKIGRGDWPDTALAWLTGASVQTWASATMDDATLRSVVSGGLPTVACCVRREEGSPGYALAKELNVVVKGAHAYTVLGADSKGLVLVRNPWGFEHPKPMTIEQFRILFPRVDQAVERW